MSLQLPAELGNVYIADEVIASPGRERRAGMLRPGRHGVAQTVEGRHLRLLGKENLGKGIIVRQEDGKIGLDLYIVVSYGTKITEVAHNIQSKVRYVLQDVLGLGIGRIRSPRAGRACGIGCAAGPVLHSGRRR